MHGKHQSDETKLAAKAFDAEIFSFLESVLLCPLSAATKWMCLEGKQRKIMQIKANLQSTAPQKKKLCLRAVSLLSELNMMEEEDR